MTTMTQAFALARAQRESEPRKPRTPLLVRAAQFAGRHVPRWERVRTNVLAVGGFGFLDFAAYELNHTLGYAAIGSSLLLIEALGGRK